MSKEERKIQRNLDGAYFRVKRNGKYDAVCFSDLTRDEVDQIIGQRSERWWKSMSLHLADCLYGLGEDLDIVKGDEEE